ncbi:MAG TPA: hypothetical protein VFV33_18470 [Gemmatimonadaceae bacterium]|nr:hypothetical protein [Gemmatimonadaceae bacterium]
MSQAADDQWVISVHPRERVIEIVYPSRVGPGAIEQYEEKVRAAATQLGAPFHVLADQRQMPVLSAEVSTRISAAVQWAQENGLGKMARLVRRSAIAELQARRVLRDAGVEDGGRIIFYTREDAWRALTSG